MVSFVQQTEGVQQTGIGNQRIVEKDLSYVDGMRQAVSNIVDSADIAATAVGKARAKDLVSEAQQTVETERKEAEEFAELNALGDDANAKQIERKTALLEKGVAQGKITRENARLRVADLVTKGIEENPFLASRIRSSAERLLGFNLESEASRQYFGSYEPAGSSSGTLGAREKQAQFLANNTGMSLSASRQLIAQQEELSLRKSIRQDKLAMGDITVDQALAQRAIEDDIEGTNAVFGDALALVREGKPLDANSWAQIAAKRENAFVQATLQEMQAAGIEMSSEQLSKVRTNASERYDRLVEQLGRFDQTFLNKQNLERLVSAQKLFGAEAMPVFSTLVNSFGDRIGSQIIDLYANAAGKPERLTALLKANPALSPFVDLLTQDPAKFSKRMNDSILKLNNPNAKIGAEDAGFIDLFLKQVVEKQDPKERASVIEKLAGAGMPTKAASVLANAGRAGADPKEVKFMQGEWDLVQGVSPDAIVDKILEGNKTLSDRGAFVELSKDGKHILLKQGVDLATGKARQATGHPAWADVQKINTFLNAADRGWAKDLGIQDVSKLANQYVNTLNQKLAAPNISDERMEELRAEARRRAGVE